MSASRFAFDYDNIISLYAKQNWDIGLPKIDSLVVVGSTCSGKTGMVRSLRDHYGDNLAIPLRYITRPRRKNDDLVENHPIPLTEFQNLIDQSRIDVWWQRPMEGSRIEHYGFAAVSTPQKTKDLLS
jgi:guanylate kinase